MNYIEYAKKSMTNVTCLLEMKEMDHMEECMKLHYQNIRRLMTLYQKLIVENRMVLKDLEMECQEQINEDLEYALKYLCIYNFQLNKPKLHREMSNLMQIYGLSDLIHRGIALVKYYSPNGTVLSEILRYCYCNSHNKSDVEVQQELGIGRTSFYKMKKQALEYLGFYFYEVVIPMAKGSKIFQSQQHEHLENG